MKVTLILQRCLKALLIASTALLIACTSLGPSTIERDHMDYGLSLNTSIQQQLLGNIVRLRYMEAPIFVDVASVINQYSLSGNVEVGLGFNAVANTANIGTGGRWEDRPTITYSPISGRKFSESLLTPISPETLFALVQSGWPTELMFRLTVGQINGVVDANPPLQADPRFREMLSVWTRLHQARIIGLRRSNKDNEKARIVLYLKDDALEQQTREDLLFLRETLGLRKGAKEFTLSYGLVSNNPDALVVLTLSILDMMVDLARLVDVPQQHIDEGRAPPTFVDIGISGPLLQVHSSLEKPEMAFVAIQNRGYWFYIDDRDLISKRTFGVLQILLSLTDSGDSAKGPVVSIGG